MAKKNKIKPLSERSAPLRKHRHFFMLNDKENKALERYLDKYKIKNKSKFIRETLMYNVIKRMEEDTPTLFDKVDD